MAWILGTANDQEIAELELAGVEVTVLNNTQEAGLFGGLRETEEDDTDKMIMVYVDVDVIDVYHGMD